MRDRYRARIVQVAGDEAEYYRTIASMLAEFQDGHTDVISAPVDLYGDRYALGLVRNIGGQAVVTSVRRTLDIPELVPGTVILERDGMPDQAFVANSDVVRRFDAALDELLHMPALIVDVRRNGGGSTWWSDRVADRFVDAPVTYARATFPRRLPHFGWIRTQAYTVRPRGKTYEGRVVVLTDVTTTSAAEAFVLAMQESGRATIVGRPTAGAVGIPISFRLPGGRVRFSVGNYQRPDGTPVEGVGVTPDIPVAVTLDDVRHGRDPILDRAIQYALRGK